MTAPQQPISPAKQQLRTSEVIAASTNAWHLELIVRSPEYAAALVADFAALDVGDSTAADRFFGAQHVVDRLLSSPSAQIQAWEFILGQLRQADAARYDRLHKGTPYYFIAFAAWLADDFEKALFYMDCAASQDLRLHGASWANVPSGLYLLLEAERQDQFARPLTEITRRHLENLAGKVRVAGGRELTVEKFRKHVVHPAMTRNPDLRAVVTAFFSFILEYHPRRRELELAPRDTGSGEPFYLHLFKGAVLFETLLKTSAAGQVIVLANPRATIGHLLNAPPVYGGLGFSVAPQPVAGHSFEDVNQAIAGDRGRSFDTRAVSAIWAIRNTTGHSLAWPRRVSPAEYDELFVLVFGAVVLAIVTLHS